MKKEMRQTVLAALLSSIAIFLLLATTALFLIVQSFTITIRDKQMERYDLTNSAVRFVNGSASLTNDVRAYAATGERKYFDSYWNEVDVLKNRDIAVENMTTIGLTEEEQAMIDAMSALSNNLIPLEDAAMAYVDNGDMPSAIESVYGERYITDITEIRTLQTAFLRMLDERTEQNILALTARQQVLQGICYLMIAITVTIQILYAILIRRRIIRPIVRIKDQMLALAAGNLDMPLDMEPSTSEIGQLVASIDTTKNELRHLILDVDMLISSARRGNLSVRADATKHKGDYQRIIAGVNETIETLVNPIYETAEILSQIEAGNLDARFTGDYQGDYDQLKTTINNTMHAIQAYIHQVTNTLAAVAQGDLSQDITMDFKGAFSALKDAIRTINDSLSSFIRTISTAAQQVAIGTQNVSDGAQSTSAGAAEQASSIDELVNTTAKISEQIRQTADNAEQSNEIAGRAKAYGERGSKSMQSLQNAMQDINNSSGDISKIIKVIDDIAFQTNILSLNAAVEAARAGVHGKGFAVVAEEVRNLAAKSADAAKDTTALIQNSIVSAELGMGIANEMATALENIVASVNEMSAVLVEIADATKSQASGISQVNTGLSQISHVVQSNSATAQESAAVAEELSSQTEMLSNEVGKFKLKNQ